MLLFGSNLENTPVVSLQTGQTLALTASPVINPYNLAIKAYKVVGPLLEKPDDTYLIISDVREISQIGIIIDSNDELVNADDVIELKAILDYDFNLIGLKVVSQKGQQLGRVSDYSIDSTSFQIFQLVIKRPAIKSFFDPELIIHRTSIVEVSNEKITVRDEVETVKSSSEIIATDFVNPFRKEPTVEANQADCHRQQPL